jgi:hypothetical protein
LFLLDLLGLFNQLVETYQLKKNKKIANNANRYAINAKCSVKIFIGIICCEKEKQHGEGSCPIYPELSLTP